MAIEPWCTNDLSFRWSDIRNIYTVLLIVDVPFTFISFHSNKGTLSLLVMNGMKWKHLDTVSYCV